MVLGAVKLSCSLSLEITGGIVVLTIHLALRAQALSGGCWLGFLLPAAVTLGPGGWWVML